MTLSRLITKLRSYTEATVEDGWTDGALEEVLLRHGEFNVKLPLVQTQLPLVFKYSLMQGHDVEAGVTVVDWYGNPVSDVTVDFNRRLVVFTQIPYGTVDMIANVYNLYEAARDIWEIKVNQRVDYVEFRAGSHRINAKQEYEHCVQRMQYYAAKTVKGFKR